MTSKYIVISLLLLSNTLSALTIGSTESAVIKALGPPPKRLMGPMGETWVYGDHHLVMIQGQLEGYDNRDAFKITMPHKHNSKIISLTQNSTKDDVLSILGVPDKIDHRLTYERWWFNGEVIEFIDNHIHIISNTKALKFVFKLTPNMRKRKMSETTTNEIIAKYGTPSTYRRGFNTDTWYYDHQFFIVQNDIITYKETWEPIQAKRRQQEHKTDFSTTEINKNLRVTPQDSKRKNMFPEPGIDPTIRDKSDHEINYYYDSREKPPEDNEDE
jgi:outer membrane protein assembly factor BamE (lipoprotein component of BamABCDE complex)